MRIYKTFLLISIFSFFSIAQTVLAQNEKLVFVGSYNMSGMMTQFAEITLQSKRIKTSNNTYQHLSLTASTYSKWDSFFKIRDIYESYVNPTSLTPTLYKRQVEEGGYRISEKYIFGKNSIKATVSRNGRQPSNQSVTIGNSTTDIVTAFYKLRKINFNNMKVGQITSFKIVFDATEHVVSVRYLGKETVARAGNLGKKVCHKISMVSQADILKGKDRNLVWLTADAQKIPVLIRFNIPVGAGQATLKSATFN